MSDEKMPASVSKRREFLRGVVTVGVASGLSAVGGEALAQGASPAMPTGIGSKPPTKATLEANSVYANQLAFNDTQDFKDASRGLIATLPSPGIIPSSRAARPGTWGSLRLLRVVRKITHRIQSIPVFGEMPS